MPTFTIWESQDQTTCKGRLLRRLTVRPLDAEPLEFEHRPSEPCLRSLRAPDLETAVARLQSMWPSTGYRHNDGITI